MENKDRILMCPPDYFGVTYVINPWMAGNEGQLSIERAHEQWNHLRGVIEENAEVLVMDPVEGFPDLVFTANAGMVNGDTAVASHFMPQERRGEEKHYKKWFANNGYELYPLPDEIGFEGAGDSLFDRGGPWLWAGHGFRTEIEAHDHLRKAFPDHELVPIKLVDPRFYHIDTCFCPLMGGYLMYHPEAFDDASRTEIEKRVPEDRRIVVDSDDAGNFACNAVNLGNRIIMNTVSDDLNSRLNAVGYEVAEVELTEFLKAGGSAKCLTLKLNEPPQ